MGGGRRQALDLSHCKDFMLDFEKDYEYSLKHHQVTHLNASTKCFEEIITPWDLVVTLTKARLTSGKMRSSLLLSVPAFGVPRIRLHKNIDRVKNINRGS